MTISCYRQIFRFATALFVVVACAINVTAQESTNDRPILFPAALQPDDIIMFVAPAGPLNEKRVRLATRRLEEMGFVVRLPENLFRKNDYLAGTDQERADELMDAFADTEVDAVFPGTGGYGATRILDKLDYDLIRKNPKVLVGYSDITALHVAIHQETGLVTFHSPTPQFGLGSEENLAPFSARVFWRAILSREYPAHGREGYLIRAESNEPEVAQSTTLVPGIAQGRLIGGNLSVVHAMMGTPYEIVTDGKILFLEDVGEAPYRVDRMLQTMQLAGKLDPLAGVVLGSFTRRKGEDTSSEEITIDQVLRSFFAQAKYPVLADFPAGHQRQNATLPMGALVELNADSGALRLMENPVRVVPPETP
ncbi:MAG: S66 peptidase family protein [Aeoliella sp.]